MSSNATDLASDGSIDALARSEIARAAFSSADGVDGFVFSTEAIADLGHGGSESLTLILKKRDDGSLFVRKILDQGLMTASWDPEGTDVMLPPWRKAKQQAAYLRSLPSHLRSYLPQVLAVSERTLYEPKGRTIEERRQLIYDMTYIPGVEVSRFIRQHRPSPRKVAALYMRIFELLATRFHVERRRVPRDETLESSYFGKIEKRLLLAHRTAPRTFSHGLLHNRGLRLNGERLCNVLEVVRRLREKPRFRAILEPRYHSLVIGDTNTENIKIEHGHVIFASPEPRSVAHPSFGMDDIGLRFLDPRAIGFHEGGVDTGADDPMYDAKPWHNSLGNYDVIHGEHFDLALTAGRDVPELEIAHHSEHPYRRSYDGIEQHFFDVMNGAYGVGDPSSPFVRDDPHWLVRFAFVMGTHFAAMPPFHLTRSADGRIEDEPGPQKRALAIYAEGVRWLNLALDMLEGRRKELFGVPVSELGS